MAWCWHRWAWNPEIESYFAEYTDVLSKWLIGEVLVQRQLGTCAKCGAKKYRSV